VAAETKVRLSLEPGKRALLLVEGIKNRAQIGIEGGNLKDRTILYPGYINIVTEIDGAGGV
jgi:hypothetical protein